MTSLWQGVSGESVMSIVGCHAGRITMRREDIGRLGGLQSKGNCHVGLLTGVARNQGKSEGGRSPLEDVAAMTRTRRAEPDVAIMLLSCISE